jgi:hypothetical protein
MKSCQKRNLAFRGDVRGDLASGKVFNAVPFAAFSAPAELAQKMKAQNMSYGIFNIFRDYQDAQTSSAPRRAGFLRIRLGKAKPSLMVAATAPVISMQSMAS